MTPEFDRRGARVMQSPYWRMVDKDISAIDKLIKERNTLQTALFKAESYADLKGEAKDIFDRAEAAADEYAKHEAEFNERLRQEDQDPKTSQGYGRFLGNEV